MSRLHSEELVDKIDYAPRHDLMGTADLCACILQYSYCIAPRS